MEDLQVFQLGKDQAGWIHPRCWHGKFQESTSS